MLKSSRGSFLGAMGTGLLAGCTGSAGSLIAPTGNGSLLSPQSSKTGALALVSADASTASIMRKAGLAAYADPTAKAIYTLPEWQSSSVSAATQATIRRHVAAGVVSPDILQCTINCGPPPLPGGGSADYGTYTAVSYTNGQLYGDNGLPDGSFVSYSYVTYYYTNYDSSGGSSIPGTAYYPSNPPTKVPSACLASGQQILQAAAAAAAALLEGGFSFNNAYVKAGLSAAGVASAYLEAGTATVAGTLAFILELSAMLTPVGWALLAGEVIALAGILISMYACKTGA